MHVSQEHFNAGELGGEGGKVRIAEVVGYQDAGLKDFCGLDALLDGHRIGLVDGKEGDVDVGNRGHLRNVLRVTGDIDAQAVEAEDVAIVASLRMEHGAPFSVIVGGNGFQADVTRQDPRPSVGDGGASAQQLHAAGVSYELRLAIGPEGLDGGLVEVVAVFMGDQDDIGLGELRIVGGLAVRADGVHMDGHALVGDGQGPVLDEGDGDFPAAVGLEGLHFAGALRLQGQGQHGGEENGYQFHKR